MTSGPLRVGNGPAGVAITPDGKYAYVANSGDGTVVRITTATMLVSGPLPVGDGPAGVAITPDGKYAYVANSGDGTVSVIRTPTGLSGPGAIDSAAVVSAPIRVGNTPVGVAITPDGKYVYVSNSGRRHGVGDHDRNGRGVVHDPRRQSLRSAWRSGLTASTST